MKPIVVSGTDTGIGKTWITLALMHCFTNAGRRVLGMKPIASGCQLEQGQLRNEDAQLIQAAGWQNSEYSLINPYAFEPPVSPHAAAESLGVKVELKKIVDCYQQLSKQADQLVIEGVGGWKVPFGQDLSLRDLAQALDAPVVLVVGLKLGCINHALLTEAALRADGVEVLGWVANQVERDYLMPEATLSCLKESISAPLLGRVPWQESREVEKIASNLAIDQLIR